VRRTKRRVSLWRKKAGAIPKAVVKLNDARKMAAGKVKDFSAGDPLLAQRPRIAVPRNCGVSRELPALDQQRSRNWLE